MHRLVRVGCICLSVMTALQQPCAISGQTMAVPTPKMHVVVVEGEAAIHDVRQRKASDLIVLVRDGNRQPVFGASVRFTLPPEGAGAVFSDGSKTQAITTNSNGYVTARGIRPNNIPGRYAIQIEAQHAGQTASTSVTHFNMTVERSKGGSGKWVAILGIVGAAAAGGTVMALRNSNGTAQGPAAPPVPISIAPGTGTVGPPR
jgi:hypothetical protein